MKKRLDILFPTPVAIIDIENKKLCDNYSNVILDSMTDENKEELDTYSNWCTKDDLHTLPEFKQLVDLVDELVKEYIFDVVGVSKDDVKLSSMWSNVNRRDTQHQIHQHPNSYFSGVLYLNIPDPQTAGNLVFVDPRPVKNMAHANHYRPSAFSDRSWTFTPGTGMMVIFPSWMEHGTARCRLEEGMNRISLSFNYSLLCSSGHTMSFNFKDN